MPDRTKTLEPPSQLRRYFVDIIGGRCLWPKRKPFDTCLSLRDFGDRYFYLMLRFLSSEDYPIGVLMPRPYLVGPRTYLHGMDGYARLAFNYEHAQFIYRIPKATANMTLIHDGSDQRLTDQPWGKIITLDHDVSVVPNEYEPWMVMPYPMHPLAYADSHSIGELRQNARSIRLFFAGNVDRLAYTDTDNSMRVIGDRFGMMDRVEVIDAVLRLPDGRIWRLKGQSELTRALTQGCRDRIVLSLKGECHVMHSEWLKTLSRCEVFLAPPGNSMPQCHNIIEAMAVGCIPLTNYIEWLSPPLTDGVNCFQFRDEKGLRKRVFEILGADELSIASMRRHVIEYHDQYLAPESFLQKFRAQQVSRMRLFANTEREDVLKCVHAKSVLTAGQPQGGKPTK